MVQGVEQTLTSSLCSILVLMNRENTSTRDDLPDAYNAAPEGLAIESARDRAAPRPLPVSAWWWWISPPIRTGHPIDLASVRAGRVLVATISDSSGRDWHFCHLPPNFHAPTATDITIIEHGPSGHTAIERGQDARNCRRAKPIPSVDGGCFGRGVEDGQRFVFTYISPADERLRGYRADEVVGRKVSDSIRRYRHCQWRFSSAKPMQVVPVHWRHRSSAAVVRWPV